MSPQPEIDIQEAGEEEEPEVMVGGDEEDPELDDDACRQDTADESNEPKLGHICNTG